jgi:putative sterol carrier protein
MGVKYLSEEYYKEVNNRIQSNEAVLGAAKGQTVSIQQVTTDSPAGELKSFLKIADGSPEVGQGDVEGPEATVTQSYETAVAIAKGELNSQNAFMQGKLKIQGNLMKLMQLQGFFQAMGTAVADIDTEY